MTNNKLILIVGPPAVGKSTLIRSIQSPNSIIAEQLGINNPNNWKLVDANVTEPYEERMILHCTISKKSFYSFPEKISKILNSSNEIVIILCYASAKVLRQRLLQRDVPRIISSIKSGQIKKAWYIIRKTIERMRVYLFQNKTFDMFDNWIKICDEQNALSHWIIDTKETHYKLSSSSQWKYISNGYN